MASKTIATILTLRDDFSRTLQNTSKNTKEFQRQLKLAENQAKNMKNSVTGAFASTAAKAAAALGIVGIGAFAKDSLMLASDLVEVQNVVDTTFGNSAKSINDFAGTAAAKFGISELQAKQFTGTLGAMMKSAGITGSSLTDMSTSLAGLSGDIASFYNLNPAEAFDKLKSGISGETEPLRALGVDISDTTVSTYALANGFNKQWKDATQAEKQLWRYKAIMKQTKDAQGDYAKTNTGFANGLRTLKLNFKDIGATIMSNFLPYFQGFVNGVNTNMPEIKKTVKELMDIAVPKFKEWGGYISDIAVKFFPSLGDTSKTTGQKLKDMFDTGLSFVTDALKWISNNVAGIKLGIEGMTAAWILHKGTLLILNVVEGIHNGILFVAWIRSLLLTGAIYGLYAADMVYQVGAKLAAGATWLFNLALDANPIVLVIAGLVLLGLAIYEVVKHWKDICEWVEKAWNWLKQWNGEPMNDKTGSVTIEEHKKALEGENALGTQYWKGGLSLVGEHGPEIVNLPGGSKVNTASTTKGLLGGNGGIQVFVTVQGNVIGNEEYADSVGQRVVQNILTAMNRV